MGAPVLGVRLRLLRALRARPHRFARLRWATQGLTLVLLYAIPLLGLARFDLWDGRHRMLGRAVGAASGVGAVFSGVLGFYVVTFALNAAMGRVFCGFGCPLGQASRLGEDAEIAAKTGRGRAGAIARATAFSAAIAGAGVLWFASPRVLVEGNARAILTTLGAFAALTALLQLHGRLWRWRFCEGYCPIGIYYSAIVTDHGFGVHFDERKGTCKECGSCDVACPVGLHPRDLTPPKNGLRGIGIDGFAEANHCLTCGECVQACELQYKERDRGLVPLRLSVHRAQATPPPP